MLSTHTHTLQCFCLEMAQNCKQKSISTAPVKAVDDESKASQNRPETKGPATQREREREREEILRDRKQESILEHGEESEAEALPSSISSFPALLFRSALKADGRKDTVVVRQRDGEE